MTDTALSHDPDYNCVSVGDLIYSNTLYGLVCSIVKCDAWWGDGYCYIYWSGIDLGIYNYHADCERISLGCIWTWLHDKKMQRLTK